MQLPRGPSKTGQACKVVGREEWGALLTPLRTQLLASQQDPPPLLAVWHLNATRPKARKDSRHVLLKVQWLDLCSIKKILHIALQHLTIHMLLQLPCGFQVTPPPLALLGVSAVGARLKGGVLELSNAQPRALAGLGGLLIQRSLGPQNLSGVCKPNNT